MGRQRLIVRQRSCVRPTEAEGRPARQALEEVQSWISRYEEQLAAGRAEIADQQKQIRELNDRIRLLEARAKPDDIGTPARSSSGAPPKVAPSVAEPADPKTRDQAAVLDQILTGPTALVSVSASKHRVIIYGTLSHRSRTYVIPHDMKTILVSFHGDDVTIVANGPRGAHLADYNMKTDRWALQDLRGGKEGQAYMAAGRGDQVPRFVLPCVLDGSGFTQVAVFDVKRSSWSIQNLVEPSEKSVVPLVRSQLAMYVLGRHAYAYSAETGTWDTLTLEERLLPDSRDPYFKGSPVLIQEDMFAVSQNGRLHLFTAKNGRWETVNPRD